MLRLYEQYRGSRDPPTPPGPWLRRGNTVRGFRPLPAGERAPRPREEGGPRRGRARPRGAAPYLGRGRARAVFPEPRRQSIAGVAPRELGGGKK